MICPLCNGRKKIRKPCDDGFGNTFVTCYACNGTGEVTMTSTEYIPKQPMTNEEYLKSLDTEQLAEWLSQRSEFLYDCGQRDVFPKIMYEEDWEWWLKQPHHEKE